MILSPGEIHAGEGLEKVERALDRFSVEEARDEAAFEEGYRALDAEFGPRGELERREVLATWFEGPRTPPAGFWSGPWARGNGGVIRCLYHLLLGRDEQGRLAGVRDCFVSVDTSEPGHAHCVVLLSHSLVLPAYRRSGLAALLRTAPVALARRAAAEAGVAPETAKVVLFAEMEPASPEDKGTVVRLIAYGRAGFRAVPPAIFPYAQPDFRDLIALGVPAVPLPLLMVVRQVGEEARLDMPRVRVEACLRQVQSVHACDSRPEDIAPIRDHALRALSQYRSDTVPLLRLPEGRGEIDTLAPLVRSAVLPLYPAAWRRGGQGDPAIEAAALAAAWSEAGREG